MAAILTSVGTPHEYTFTELETSGNTTDYLPVGDYSNHAMVAQVKYARQQVFLRVEGSMDGTYWFNPDTSGNTGDGSGNTTGWSRGKGTYFFQFPNRKLKYIRGKWCANGTGATYARVLFRYLGG